MVLIYKSVLFFIYFNYLLSDRSKQIYNKRTKNSKKLSNEQCVFFIVNVLTKFKHMHPILIKDFYLCIL